MVLWDKALLRTTKMENILDEAITPTRIKEILEQFKSNLVSCFLKKWEDALDKDTLDPQSSNKTKCL